MQFQTITKITPLRKKIDHNNSIFSLGSCFAENIARKLAERKFHIAESPSGILFNPESIARSLEIYQQNLQLSVKELMLGDEGWFSYDFHSSLSHIEQDTALSQMQLAIDNGHKALKEADVVIITFGTAMVYTLKEQQRVVANCHKQPQQLFTRSMLSVEDIVQRYSLLMEGVLRDKLVIFTVSPVRHLSDGLEENSLSKATLRLAIDAIVKRFANAKYFPSYEILCDELRDYRFYAEDMVHPSAVAVEYIWECFGRCYFDNGTQRLNEEIETVIRAIGHRPLDAQSEGYKNFLRNLLDKIGAIEEKYSYIDFENEKTRCSTLLKI